MEVNIVKGKKLTNMRASGSDENLKISPKLKFSLEELMEQIKDDEYLEVTPANLRIRKIPVQRSY
jgi:GTP-binding protein